MTRSRGFLLNMLGKEASPTPFVVACTMLDLLVPRLVNDDSPYLDQLANLANFFGQFLAKCCSFSAVQVPARVPKRAPLVELVLTMTSFRDKHGMSQTGFFSAK